MSSASLGTHVQTFDGLGGGPHSVVNLEDAVTVHQLALAAAGRSPQTLRLYLLYERRFLQYLEERHIPSELDQLNAVNARQAVLWFQQRRLGARRGEIATAMFLKTLKTWSNFLEQEGVYVASPLHRVRPMHTRHIERQPYTRAEVNAMLHACDVSRQPERDRLLVLLLLDTGGRISEICGLRLQDVRMDTRTVRVLGKGNRERSIPVGNPSQSDGGPLFRALRSWLKVRDQLARRHPERAVDRLLLTLPGYPLTGEGGTTAIKRLGAAAGVDHALAHRYRHTFATIYLTTHPGDEIGLRRILGQISNDVLTTYVHLSQAAMAERMGGVSLSSGWLRDG